MSSEDTSEKVSLTRDELSSLLNDVDAKFKQTMDEREAKIKSDMEAKFKSEMAEKLAAAEKKNKEELEATMKSLKKGPGEEKPASGGVSRKAALLSAAAALKAEQDAAPKEAVAPKAGSTKSALLSAAAAMKAEQAAATKVEKAGSTRSALLSAAAAMKAEQAASTDKDFDAEIDVDEIIEKRNSARQVDGKQSALLAGAVGKLMVQKSTDEKPTDDAAAAAKLAAILGKVSNGGEAGTGNKSKFAGAIGKVMQENRVEKRKEEGGGLTFADVVEDVVVQQRISAIVARNRKKLINADAAFTSRRSSSKLLSASLSNLSKDIEDEKAPLKTVDDKGEEDEEDDDDLWHAPFGETIYTLIYMCPPDSQAFWFSIFIYSLQLVTVLLTLIDIVDPHISNPLQIPAMVATTVTIAQGVTLFLVLGYMSDLIEGVIKIQDGFYPEILEVHPGATYGTWLTSCLVQLSSGILVLVGSFILTMQASTVIDLMLNLTALLFISEIDDLGFLMAKMGFITDRIQMQSEAVADFEVPIREKKNTNRRILYTLMLAGLMIGYGVIKQKQLDGSYLPNFVYVQFGDAYNPQIPFFSGILASGNVRTSGYRKYFDEETRTIMLSFCRIERAWTFSDSGDPCDYFAKSSTTETFDVTGVPVSEWYVKDQVGRLQRFDTFSLVGRDCNYNFCKGTCVDGLCECPNDMFGMDCEFSNVCPDLILDGRVTRLPVVFAPNVKPFLAAEGFEVLKNQITDQYVRVYNMPVYYSQEIKPASIMFFGGRRWVITSEDGFLNITALSEEFPGENFFPQQTAEKFETEFHGFAQAKYKPYFLSDPVDYETPLFRPSPAGLGWWSVGIRNETARLYVPDSKVETVFNCLSCTANEEGFCGIGGTCNTTSGLCECHRRYTGKKCEMQASCLVMDHPCLGDGICDRISGTCTCNLPYGDKLCLGTFACYEDGGQCQNGGECPTDGFPYCTCPDDPHITGIACEKHHDCHVFGCANGGVCAFNGKCVCRPPFHGILCDMVNTTQEELLCTEDDHCMNGSCNSTTGVCACEDPSTFGTLCEHEYHCSWGGCNNDGVCNEDTGVCDCPFPFFGPDCAREPNCLEDDHCETTYGPGSACDAGTGTCRCGWPWFFPGKKCVANCRLDGGCKNGGTCNAHGNCECPPPFSGNYCDLIAEDISFGKNDITGKTQACTDENGFPPYAANETDCTRIY